MKIPTKPIDAVLLDQELTTASVPHHGVSVQFLATEVEILTHDPGGRLIDLPPEAEPVVDAHVAPPRAIAYARTIVVDAVAVTTDDQAKEVLRFPCDERRRYRASLTISGVDRGNFVSREMEGRFVWKRVTGNAVMVGIEIVSNLGEPASAAWAPNALPEGTDVVFTVKGAAGRTVDWLLEGSVGEFAPGGLEA